MGFLWILVATFSISMYYAHCAKLLKTTPQANPLCLFAFSYLAGAVLLFFPWIFSLVNGNIHFPVNREFWMGFFISNGLMLIAKIAYFKALPKLDLALMSAFSGLTPLVAIVFGYLVLHELPSTNSLLAILLVCFSIFFLFQKQWNIFSAPSLQAMVKPFCTKEVMYALLSVIPPSMSIVFQRYSVIHQDPVNYSFFSVGFVGGTALCGLFLMQPREVFAQIKLFHYSHFIKLGLLLSFYVVTFSVMAFYYQAAYVSALGRLSIVFQFILGYLYLHEKAEPKKRLFLLVAIFLANGWLYLTR
jgi:drug/metabolite transporter (DMT)-like permease